MGEYNKNLQELQHIIKKSIYGNANIVSNKNSMFDKCLENIKREFYNNDIEAFYKYMEDYFYPIVYNIENINLDKIYLEFIKSTIVFNIFKLDEYKDFPLTIVEYSDLFNIHITEEDCSNYHSSHINYKLESNLMTPELLETINKYSECDFNISIYNGGISLIPKNGYSAINYILDEANDISSKYDISKTLEMFRKLYIKLNGVNEFINNKILN